MTGKKLSDIQTPSLEAEYRKALKLNYTKHPLRSLGFNTDDGPLYLSEEERESHVHIIGSPGEGKSKFLEMMMCEDINRLQSGKSKSGLCFIDSSDNGKTLYKVLKHCAKIGFDKVFLIEPGDIGDKDYGYVPLLNPLDYHAPSEAMGSLIMDTLRVLWSTEDFSKESIINKYAKRVVEAVHSAEATLPDIETFTIPEFARQRNQYIYNDRISIATKLVLQRAMTHSKENSDFQTTARRFEPFFDNSLIKLMLGSKKSADFNELITGGWVILCNLYPEGLYDEPHQRLLGTLVLNRIMRSMSRVIGKVPSYNVPYYIYIDEFGKYATKKIADLLYYSRKSNLRLNLAHQEFSQIENPQVLAAVKSAAKIKVLFYTASPKDRKEALSLMFAGPIQKDTVDYVLSQTEKQHAFIKINKQSPRKIRVIDWPDPKVSEEEVAAFKRRIYQTNPQLYTHKAIVREEIKNRSAITEDSKFTGSANLGKSSRHNSKTPKRGARDDRGAAIKSEPLLKGEDKAGTDIGPQQAKAGGTPSVSWNLHPDDAVPKTTRKARTRKAD
jgi:hypothetical protein